MRNKIKRARVALQSELMKQQHWIAIPTGEMPLGKDLLTTIIWKGASAADAVGILGTGLSSQTSGCGRKEQQGLRPSVGTGEKRHQGLVHTNGEQSLGNHADLI